jgi:hypothetical protein
MSDAARRGAFGARPGVGVAANAANAPRVTAESRRRPQMADYPRLPTPIRFPWLATMRLGLKRTYPELACQGHTERKPSLVRIPEQSGIHKEIASIHLQLLNSGVLTLEQRVLAGRAAIVA